MTEILRNRLPSIMETCKESILHHGRMGYGVWVEIAGEEKLSVVTFDKSFRMNSKQDFYDALFRIGKNFLESNTKIVAVCLMTETVTMNIDPVTGKKHDAISLGYQNLVNGSNEVWIQPYTRKGRKVEFEELSIDPKAELYILDNFIAGYQNL